MLDDTALAARHARSQRAAYRVIATSSADGRTVEPMRGVQASIVPARPERSVFNAVVYDDADALLAAYDEVAALYAAAGVRAWTVWTPPGDRPQPRP